MNQGEKTLMSAHDFAQMIGETAGIPQQHWPELRELIENRDVERDKMAQWKSDWIDYHIKCFQSDPPKGRYQIGMLEMLKELQSTSSPAPKESVKKMTTPTNPEVLLPLKGEWRYNNGYLCCGTLRVMRADFDTNPAEEFKNEVGNFIANSLNTRAHPTPPELSTECKCDNGSWSSSPLGYMPPSYCKCAKTTPPSDGAAAPAGNGSHPSVGESVAVLPEGVMSAENKLSPEWFADELNDVIHNAEGYSFTDEMVRMIEARDKIRNAQLSQAKGDGWQTMESAPYDRKVDLLWCGSRYIECFRDPLDGGWRTTAMRGQIIFITSPTHWREIPAAPQASEGGN